MRNFFATPPGPLFENGVDIVLLSDYNFSNFPYSGVILPFVLTAMMYLVVV